jgi:GMP synthase-like glutamine amidotransferase
MPMNVHILQHVPFEGPAAIEQWLAGTSATVSFTRFFEAPALPDLRHVDWLIVMGGPMSANDEDVFPWLRAEKQFIADAIAAERLVLGVCLGAQLIASALGSAVYANAEKEIGWFPVERVPGHASDPVARIFPDRAEVFHWHGETFDLPPGARNFARSDACVQQAFSLGERVVGLQFHLETTPSSLKALVDNCPDDLVPGRLVQTEAEMTGRRDRFENANRLMRAVLETLARCR